MSKLTNTTPEQEREFIRKAKQYERVKWIIIISSIVLAVVLGVIVVSNGAIFRLLGVQNYAEGLSIFFIIMYVLIMIGILLLLIMISMVFFRIIVEFIKDKFFRK